MTETPSLPQVQNPVASRASASTGQLHSHPHRSTGEVLLELRAAGVKRDGRWLVRGVDFTLARGEIVTLIGPNGSGKSTTTKLALGLLMPDEGRVTRLPGLRVGYVPQKLSIDGSVPLSVSRFLRLTQRLTAAQIATTLTRTGAAHLAEAPVQSLSGGEFQRVMLARAIALRPDLLVLDEPVQGVDIAGEAALYALIQSLRDELDCALLLVSHDLHVVMAATDQVVCLNGHMCCSGSPRAVANAPAYRQLFGSAPSGVLALYEHEHQHCDHPEHDHAVG